MKKNTFKNLIKEALADQLSVTQAQCVQDDSISICDLLGPEKSQKLIDAGEILRSMVDRKFKPEDIEYMTNIISVAKREFGDNDEEVQNLELAVKKLMSIDGQIEPAKELDLKENFIKFKL
jgi:hypothetical protein